MAPLILKSKNMILLLAIVYVFDTTMCDNVDGLIHAPKATVTIKNALNESDCPGSESLKVHCKSYNDDLGWYDIPLGGSYSFSFHPRWWGGTLFFCGMEWPGVFHHFDIYVQERDQDKCNHCCWWVKTSGACRCPCQSPNCTTPCFPWNK